MHSLVLFLFQEYHDSPMLDGARDFLLNARLGAKGGTDGHVSHRHAPTRTLLQDN